MTENQAAQLLLERLHTTEAQTPKPMLVSHFPSILQNLANKIASQAINRPAIRELLRKDFSISVSSGVGDLSSAFTDTEPLLESFARGWIVTSPTDLTLGRPFPYSYKADKASIQNDQPLGLGLFAVDGTNLIVVTSTGNRTVTATYNLHGAYVPSLANLPTILEDDWLNTGVELIQGMPQAAEATN